MKTALVFINGEISDKEIKKVRHSHFDHVLAADGGVFNALKADYYPEYIVGDLDSVTSEIKQIFSKKHFVYRPSQAFNDLEKMLVFCEELGVTEITLVGIGGKRLDHTLNNLSVLSRYDQAFQMTIYDTNSQIFLVRDEWHYEGPEKQLVSLLPMSAAMNVRTKGLAFALNNEPLIFGQREGLSNYIVESPVSVQITEGLLLIFVMNL